MAAPEDEDARFGAPCNCGDGGIGNGIPALSGVRARLPGLYRQRIVEQQDALPRPMFQIAMRSRYNSKVVLQFLVDIDERRGKADAARH